MSSTTTSASTSTRMASPIATSFTHRGMRVVGLGSYIMPASSLVSRGGSVICTSSRVLSGPGDGCFGGRIGVVNRVWVHAGRRAGASGVGGQPSINGPAPIRLGGCQGFGWGEAACSDGWVKAGECADEHVRRDGAADGPGGHHGRPALQARIYGGDRGAEQHPGSAAERGQQHRLGEELDADLPTGGAERAAQPD